MNYYQDANKIIFRRYRMIRKIIWSLKYENSIVFSNYITTLTCSVYRHMMSLYGSYSCLFDLNNYYKAMCIDEMNERIKLEKSF